MRSHKLLCVLMLLFASLLGCGSGAPNAFDSIQVTISPAHPEVTVSDTLLLQATLSSAKDPSVSWTVLEPGGGSVASSGLYTAPLNAGTYHVMATSVENPKKSATVAISVLAAPIIDLFTATPTPGGASLLAAFRGGTGAISPGVGPVLSGTNYPVSPTVNTTYTLTVTNRAGKATQATVDVTLPASIQSFLASPSTIVQGQLSALTPVFSNGTGSIDNGVGVVLSGQSYPVSPVSTTIYTLTVMGGTSVASTTTVTVQPPLQIGSFTAQPAIIYPGGTATLAPVFAGGTGSIDHGVGVVVSGQAYPVSPLNSTTYTLTITDAVGGQLQASALVTIRAHGGFSPTGPIGTARKYHTATLLQDGAVLVAGGLPKEEADNGGVSIPALDGAERYNAAAGLFSPVGIMRQPRYGHSACLLADGRVLLTGGNVAYDPLAPDPVSFATNTAELFDPTTGSFSVTTAPMGSARRWHTSTLLQDGTVLIAGGIQGDGAGNYTPLASAELFDPVSGTFSPVASNLTTPRQMHQAVPLIDGSVLLLGGVAYTGTVPYGLLSADRYVGSSSPAFSATLTSMAAGRGLAAAVRLNSGQVLVAGGLGSAGTWLSSMELYSPSGSTFALTASLANAVRNPVAVLLADGRVALFGTGDAEIYDPATNIATSVPGLGLPARDFLSVTAVVHAPSSTGQVLVVDLDGATLFDPLNP